MFSRSLLSLCCSGHAAVRRLSRCIPVLRRCFLPAAASLNPGLADRPGPGCERISPAGSTGADRNLHRGGRREGRKEGRKKGASIATNRSHGIIGRCLPLCVCVCVRMALSAQLSMFWADAGWMNDGGWMMERVRPSFRWRFRSAASQVDDGAPVLDLGFRWI